MAPLVRKFNACDFRISSAISEVVNIGPVILTEITVTFDILYDEKVFPYLPQGFEYFRLHTKIGDQNFFEHCGIRCSFCYSTSRGTPKQSIELDINELIEMLDNEGWIASLRLSGFYLD